MNPDVNNPYGLSYNLSGAEDPKNWDPKKLDKKNFAKSTRSEVQGLPVISISVSAKIIGFTLHVLTIISSL